MPDELKREEVIARVRRETVFNSIEATNYVDMMLECGVPLSKIETGTREYMENLYVSAYALLNATPPTPDTGEKECEDCGQVKDDVVLCQNPLEDAEEDLMWLCEECHDSRNEEV